MWLDPIQVDCQALVQRLLATGGWGWVMRQMAKESQGVLGLMLAQWWMESGSGVSDCGAGGLGSSFGLLCVGSFLTWLGVVSGPSPR